MPELRRQFLWLLAIFLFLAPVASRAAAPSLEIDYSPLAFTATSSLNIATSSVAVNLPWQWQPLTPAYDYSFVTSGLYDPSRPLTLTINYGSANHDLKQIFIFDDLAQVWRPIPTTDVPGENYVTGTTTSLAGRVMVAADTDILTVGTASWYKYKNGLFAASPDFAKGSVLRVTDPDTGHSIDVTVNDYGPDRTLFPDRVVDLDYVAFQKLAPASAGLINVEVTPLKVVGSILNKPLPPTAAEPTVTATSAVIVREKTGQILWGKNADAVSPLASLTKIVAARVFLDTKPDLNKIVVYKYQDEAYNYKYCKPAEAARVRLRDGDKISEKDLLYSALVGSANNAVESLVRVSGLSRPAFIKKMNDLVHSWGATSTNFVEPTGLSPDNVSSPHDYAIITKAAFSNPLLSTVTTTSSYTFTTRNTRIRHQIRNTDHLLQSATYDIIGSKTGYLDEAGHCLMTRVKTAEGNLIVINFHSRSSAANFADNEQLIDYGVHLLKK